LDVAFRRSTRTWVVPTHPRVRDAAGVSLPSLDLHADRARDSKAWHSQTADVVASAPGTSIDSGLTSDEAAARLAQYGPNALKREAKVSVWRIVLQQLSDPMNVMLVVVTWFSLVIAEWSTALVVGLLVALNVVLGTRQVLKARASVDALTDMQIPQARVVRDGAQRSVPATDVVPGDLVAVEAGDFVVADGRIARSATVETQEAALTGESAPIAKRLSRYLPMRPSATGRTSSSNVFARETRTP
jgi:P-type Ca2+ transporter type 2C